MAYIWHASIRHLHEGRPVLDSYGLDGIQTAKGSFFKFNKVSSVSCSSFCVDDERWEVSFFAFDLPLRNHLEHVRFLVFARSVQEETPHHFGDSADTRKFSNTCLGDMARGLPHHVD